jgi:hypothetical protein
MKFIDSETAVLTDGSFINFKKDGGAELFPSSEWKRPRGKKGSHVFNFKSKDQAIKVFYEIERNIGEFDERVIKIEGTRRKRFIIKV